MDGDGGGKAPQWANQIVGAENVARVLAAIVRALVLIGGVVEPHEVNGQPGAIFRDRDGKVLSTLALDILDGQIQTIRSVINPDKLGHVGPVADAWAVLREANQAPPAHRLTARADRAPDLGCGGRPRNPPRAITAGPSRSGATWTAISPPSRAPASSSSSSPLQNRPGSYHCGCRSPESSPMDW